LKRLRKSLIAAGEINAIDLEGVRAERSRVLPGGLAILIAIFKTFGLETMATSPGALREGVLYDLVGRIRHEDVRDRTIRRLVRQYRVDPEQGSRVERTALILLQRVCPEWRGELLPRKLLIWASRLHEIGLALSHSGFHKHGAYLVASSDMPGFSGDDQATLASLIRGHRRKLSEAVFDAVPSGRRDTAVRLCVVLRLAVLLNRSRATGITPALRAEADWSELTLTFAPGWTDHNPLTRADLDREARYLRALDIQLEYREATAKEPVRP
jgi:exopolyphosphatase/guanosine-5'-triphosphate,3'-diphosphate pyrophosphatase